MLWSPTAAAGSEALHRRTSPWRISQISALDQLPLPIDRVVDLYPMTALSTGLLFTGLQNVGHECVCESAARRHRRSRRGSIQGGVAGGDRPARLLRTGFLHEGEHALQWISKQATFPLVEEDWRTQQQINVALDALAEAQRTQPFDLLSPPLCASR